ncbi:8824f4b5-3595-43a6-a2d9-f11a89b7d655 [Sclerotinia trifoliorum]|uniref:8824f4b5-3595-43a6-a2d9-f11a89b7d655 n=1 Tax=Sclerotinia trifoliorum TaxID=28548 RepID=A0A8H2ZKB3_9HELO|nr:8824f4b5-3595-43a6-a2d9-f11a89b7d655 [Sclerotinia trifoliorum]
MEQRRSNADQSSTAMDQNHSQDSDEPAQKRRRVDDNANGNTNGKGVRRGMNRSVSPPPLRRYRKEMPIQEEGSLDQEVESYKQTSSKNTKQKVVKSPFQLTSIRDLPASSNVDTVSLRDILGDPLISECWEFNYLHNLDFLMEQFDEDVRNLVKVNVVHGFWKREDQSRLNLMEQVLKYSNVKLLTAYMPEMFGTHHSKMLILFRHDSTAQVIIHTANMIPFDWTNMTQAMWKSPLLPLLDPEKPNPIESQQIGSGSKFKIDLLNYLRAYDTKRAICKPLIEQLSKHDFSEIRAALVASTPGKQDIELDSTETAWGWAGLTNVLKSIPCSKTQPEIVVQISSIASLGSTDKWLNQTFFKAFSTSNHPSPKPKFKIIFPTADEIRRSINGYSSGSAIHTKILTPAQGKQVAYLKPLLCHWAGDGEQHSSSQTSSTSVSATSSNTSNTASSSHMVSPSTLPQNAHRKRAAPHIKTYIRFSSSSHKTIDWMLVTSANLSKQAWGENTNTAGEVRICSYEIGVMVWPELWDEGKGAKMVPCFGRDTPSRPDVTSELEYTVAGEATSVAAGDNDVREKGKGREEIEKKSDDDTILIGARMPYDLPLIPYTKSDIPWCASASYSEPDWMGNTWKT